MRRSAATRYLEALVAEIDREVPRPAQTIFFGGGTPNAYAAEEIAELTERLRRTFSGPEPMREISIELNPELVGSADLATYRAAGIDRVSIGVQSFEPSEIATLGRKHSADQVAAAVAQARAAAMRSVSLDLIFAVPGQTAQTWRRSLETAIGLGVDHISTYGLTIEEGTPYARWHEREPRAFAGNDLEADLYDIAIETLEEAGYEHYEISNFAKPNHASVHNANYWRNGDYLGLGVGAASYRDGIRSVHTRSLDEYVRTALAGDAIPGESERLEGLARTGEAVMLALRTAQGVCLATFKERYGIDVIARYAPVVEQYQGAGLLDVTGDHVRLTRRGRFVANDVCGAFVTFE
jgi:oxygen-independent coproporphyrinogen-3 oxidase